MTALDKSQLKPYISSSNWKRRKAATAAGQYIMLILLTGIFIFPLIFMIMSSFKPTNAQIFSDLRSIRAFLPVGDLSLTNYVSVFENSKFPRFLLNSIGMSGVMIVLSLLVNSMAAYSLSRLRWKARKIVLAVIIALLIVPFETIAIPLLLMVSKLPNLTFDNGVAFAQGWLNTYQVQIVPFIAGAGSIFLFYQFFLDIPKELDEAALIDGASKFQIYRHVIVPNSGPVFATVAILTFLGTWNSFLWPIMTVQSEDIRPVMVGLQYFFQLNVQWGQVMAYTTMITIPVLALFMAFQGAFVRSIASTGIKG
jgi:multiple sugar transport system permease protein